MNIISKIPKSSVPQFITIKTLRARNVRLSKPNSGLRKTISKSNNIMHLSWLFPKITSSNLIIVSQVIATEIHKKITILETSLSDKDLFSSNNPNAIKKIRHQIQEHKDILEITLNSLCMGAAVIDILKYSTPYEKIIEKISIALKIPKMEDYLLAQREFPPHKTPLNKIKFSNKGRIDKIVNPLLILDRLQKEVSAEDIAISMAILCHRVVSEQHFEIRKSFNCKKLSLKHKKHLARARVFEDIYKNMLPLIYIFSEKQRNLGYYDHLNDLIRFIPEFFENVKFKV